MMKKLFYGGNDRSGWIGKQFQCGRHVCTVEETIAEGGFALVFLVRTSSGYKCALKRISVNDPTDLHVCKQEIQILKMLSGHKNAISLIDSAVNMLEPGIFEVLMLMEFCRAGNVIDLMNENLSSGFAENLIMKIFCDTCEALSLMHHNEPPVLHRDLKVENILRKETGDFVLCDFGSAMFGVMNPAKNGVRQVEDDLQKYTTISYRAPEMIDLYAGHLIGTKSDIWALGCLLFKLCFFTTPFGESTLAIQSGQFTFPETSKYSKDLHALICYILNPDPEKRPDIYQVASLAFKMAGKPCPVPNKNSVSVPQTLSSKACESTATKDSIDSKPSSTNNTGPVITSVAPRERPVTTSLAPRRRPKGNNQTIDSQEETAAPFKHPHVTNIQNGSGLRRSHSLKEVSNTYANSHAQQQQSNQLEPHNNMYQQNVPLANHQSQYSLTQQQQQREIYIRQQQQQLQYYQQLHHQQQQQQEFIMRQQQQQQQEYLNQQREILMRQQEQEMQIRQQQQTQAQQQQLQQQQQQQAQQQQLQQQQQQKDDYIRSRQEQYNRLQKLRLEEEKTRHKMEQQRLALQRHQQDIVDNEFNPRDDQDVRMCKSVEPPSSPMVDKVSPAPIFDDDFSRSSPDLSNPFTNKTQPDAINPFNQKKKTHNRSRSDTFTRLGQRQGLGNAAKLVGKSDNPAPRRPPVPPIQEPLTVDTSDPVIYAANPFRVAPESDKNNTSKHTANSKTPKKIQDSSDVTSAPIKMERQDSNVETGILLEIDDDEHFQRLQKELNELGVMKQVDLELETLGITKPAMDKTDSVTLPVNQHNDSGSSDKLNISRAQAHSDGSPLISPAISPPHGERKYVYQRTSSCSSSNSSGDDFSNDEGDEEQKYQDCNSKAAHMDPGAELVNTSDGITEDSSKRIAHSEKDVFGSAPFQIANKEERLDEKQTNTIYSTSLSIQRQKAKKVKRKPVVKQDVNPFDQSNPFDDHFTGSATSDRQRLDSDPFGMAPMKLKTSQSKLKPKPDITRHVNQSNKDSTESKQPAQDPFGSAPFVKANRNVKNVPSSDLHVKIEPRKRRVLPNVPPDTRGVRVVTTQAR